ncbi:NAD(P)/FAD-dependent oxidoreductase [Actinomadura hibisca]|uniref:NAD(P)/FAD-dependent oxidoreductase n=1 Tax=Actinomadura hibisca TaxID=68565 RepID=UPI00083383CF|nr:FAD-dependent oxidoreductase [Actinomadura hibisca]
MRIIIVGAGIIGAALADRLVHDGLAASSPVQITVIDDHPPGSGTSGTSLAWLNANDPSDLAYHSLRVAALRTWQELAAGFSNPAWYRPVGNITWATAASARKRLAARVNALAAHNYPARLITEAQLQHLEPAARRPAPEAVIAHYPGEGYADGIPAVQALLDRASRAGATVLKEQVARLISRGSQVTGVRLASGQDLVADVTICAAGWRSPILLATIGLQLALADATEPRSPAPCLIATTTSAPGMVTGLLHTPDLYLRSTIGQRLLLEASDLDTDIDMTTPQPHLDELAAELLDRARRLLPGLNARIAQAKRCVRPLPTDDRPLIGWQQEGLYTVVTHSGMTLGPHLARLTSREILADETAEVLAAYRPGRF